MTIKSSRVAQAGGAFLLTFATAALVWQGGRRAGLTEAVPHPTVPSVTAFTDPATAAMGEQDFSQQVSALIARGRAVGTKEEARGQAQKLYALARSAHFQSKGEGKLSLEAYQEALRLFRRAGDSYGEADVLLDLSETHALLGHGKEAEEALRAALALRKAGVGAPSQYADTLYRFGSFLQVRGQYQEARTSLDQALQIQQRWGNETGIADCLSAMGQVAYEEGSLALSRQLLTDAADRFAKNGKVESRAAVLGQLGDVALKQGEVAEAKQLYQEGLHVWEERHQGFWTGRFLVRLAQVALKENDLPRAERLAEEGRHLLSVSNGPVAQARALVVLGQIARRKGESQNAKRYIAEAEAIYRVTGNAAGLSACRAAGLPVPQGFSTQPSRPTR